jgi:hypothetical protein
MKTLAYATIAIAAEFDPVPRDRDRGSGVVSSDRHR